MELDSTTVKLHDTWTFKILPNKRLGEIINDTKSFVRTIRPIDIDIKSIPPIRIPYFDPETQKYGLTQNKAISINVTPASELTAFDAIIQGDSKLKNNVEEKKGIPSDTYPPPNASDPYKQKNKDHICFNPSHKECFENGTGADIASQTRLLCAALSRHALCKQSVKRDARFSCDCPAQRPSMLKTGCPGRSSWNRLGK